MMPRLELEFKTSTQSDDFNSEEFDQRLVRNHHRIKILRQKLDNLRKSGGTSNQTSPVVGQVQPSPPPRLFKSESPELVASKSQPLPQKVTTPSIDDDPVMDQFDLFESQLVGMDPGSAKKLTSAKSM